MLDKTRTEVNWRSARPAPLTLCALYFVAHILLLQDIFSVRIELPYRCQNITFARMRQVVDDLKDIKDTSLEARKEIQIINTVFSGI